MEQVISSASMSLDGYIAKDDNTIGALVRLVAERVGGGAERQWGHHVPPEPAQRGVLDAVGRGSPSRPVPLRHRRVEAAVATAQAIARDRTVAVTAGIIAGQCLRLGLRDAVAIDLVPVVMGQGPPYFGGLSVDDIALGDPSACIEGDRVTHLMYPVAPAKGAPG